MFGLIGSQRAAAVYLTLAVVASAKAAQKSLALIPNILRTFQIKNQRMAARHSISAKPNNKKRKKEKKEEKPSFVNSNAPIVIVSSYD